MPLDKLPETHKKHLLSCFRNLESSWYPGWHYVWPNAFSHDAEENNTHKWLTQTFGIHTDQPIFKIGDSFKVMFCWYTMSWLVSV